MKLTDQASTVLGLLRKGTDANGIMLLGVTHSEAETDFIIEQLKQAKLI